MIETFAAIEAIKKVNDALSVMGKCLEKLRSKPDLAALKLAETLDEIGKTYQAVDKAITDFLRLGIDHNGLEQGSEVLLKIEGGGLLVDVKKAKGHCQVIDNIYSKYLDKWFNWALFGDDLNSMHFVFLELCSADSSLFERVENIAAQLQESAKDVLDKIYAGQTDAAKNQIVAARQELLPIRIAMSEALQQLYTLKGEFIKIGEIA